MKYGVFAVLSVLLAAGCVGQTDGGGGTTVGSADVIVANAEPTIPSQPASGTAFTARFTVKNQDTEKTANDVGIWIFDTGRCTLKTINGADAAQLQIGTGSQLMWPGLNIQTASGYQHIVNFAPGRQEVVRLDMDAPTSEQIAGLPATCPIRYRVNYSFSAVSEMTVQAISTDRLAAREAETGARPIFTRTLNVGAGPIRVMLEPRSAMPVETGRTLRVEITVKNDGTGEFDKVEADTLLVTFDKDWLPVMDENQQACGGVFIPTGNAGEYTNVQAISLVQQQSNPITCEWTAPPVNMEKQYVMQARLPYMYDYFGKEITVPITP